MDEAAFRQRMNTLNVRSCPFAKTILTGCASCSKTEKFSIAERELVACRNEESHQRCSALRDLLRHNFTFTLGRMHIDGPLPHAQEMRMQCGGLKGLQIVLDGNEGVLDIDKLLTLSLVKFGGLSDLPYSQIVRLANTRYKPR